MSPFIHKVARDKEALKVARDKEALTILLIDQEIREALKIADHVSVLELGRHKFEGPVTEFTDLEKAFWLEELIRGRPLFHTKLQVHREGCLEHAFRGKAGIGLALSVAAKLGTVFGIGKQGPQSLGEGFWGLRGSEGTILPILDDFRQTARGQGRDRSADREKLHRHPADHLRGDGADNPHIRSASIRTCAATPKRCKSACTACISGISGGVSR